MRLHRLELTAIGPFATQQSIDFDELGAGGLFLLDGPTGAGKTTVLDAITFALYGPGERNGDGRLHSDFAAVNCEPFVQLEFSIRGVRQRISRSPEYERLKRRGDGTTRQQAQAHLERWQDGSWVSRSSNKAEIADMLADDVGLSRDQFTQVVLLPQGEFARFLRASDDDRRSLLTKLFGTQLYDRITDELERQGQAATRDLDAAMRLVRSCVSAAGEAAGLSAGEREDLCDLPADQLRARLARVSTELTAVARTTRDLAAVATGRTSAARQAAATATATADRLQRLAAAVAARASHERTRSVFDEARARHAAGQRAESVRALLSVVDETNAELEAAHIAVRAADPQHNLGPATGADVTAISARAAELSREAAELQHLVSGEAEALALHAEWQRAEQQAEAAELETRASAARLSALPAEVDAAKSRVDEARGKSAAGVAAGDQLAQLERRLSAARRVVELVPTRETAAERRTTCVTDHQQAVDDHQRAVDARLSGIAAELAGRLTDGEPCPVCGASDHPQPARPTADAVTAAQVQDAERRRAEAAAARERAERLLADLDTELAACRAVADGGTVEDLTIEFARLTVAADSGAVSEAELPRLHAAHETLHDEQQAVFEAHATALAAGAGAVSTATALRAQYRELDAALVEARAGYSSIGERQQALRDEAERAEQLVTVLRRCQAAADAHDLAIARAEAEARAAGFGDLADARAAALDANELGELRGLIEQWQQQLDQLLHSIRAADVDELGADEARLVSALDQARADAHRTDADLAAAVELSDRAAADAARARHALERFTDRVTDIETASAGFDHSAKTLEPVRYLSRLTRGMAGRRRVALTTFVLRRWFEHVVDAANVRLTAISSGRYELVRVDEGQGKAERTGLTLQVIDRHTGEARSTRSLSGGETFYTSLALALGLADVVRAEAGGIDLDTLFIDEGFGSLDAETLDEVMAVIEDLRDRGRVIGIVSHLADLKELIHERIEVRRLEDGSSALRVVA